MTEFPPNTKALGVVVLAWALLVAAAAGWLRFTDLESMPVHADEAATGGQTLAHRLEGNYEFDPKHHHGPLLTALAAPWSRLAGEKSWETLTIGTMRSMVALCGLLTVVALLGLGMGWERSAVAMGLAGTSPLLVYYSRVFIHEPVFSLFAIVAVAGWLWLLRGRRRWLAAIVFGSGAGGMAATRETVVISLFSWALAGLCYLWRKSDGRNVRVFSEETVASLWRPVAVAAGLCLAVIFWFHSSGGREPAGFLGFFTTYFEYEVGEGHEKPTDYYLQLLVWPKMILGRWWLEGGVFLLALGVWFDRRENEGSRAGRFFFEAGMMHLVAFSLIGYKTPWLVCLGWLHFCVAGGYGAVALTRATPKRWALVPVAAAVAITFWQGVQAGWATGRLAADGRNPYAYVPTSKDMEGLGEWLNEVRAAVPGSMKEPMAVVGDQYWPLPWYLREAGEVGYRERMPDRSEGLPVVVLTPAFFEEGAARLGATHSMIPKGLRDEVAIVVAVRDDIWDLYQKRVKS